MLGCVLAMETARKRSIPTGAPTQAMITSAIPFSPPGRKMNMSARMEGMTAPSTSRPVRQTGALSLSAMELAASAHPHHHANTT